MPTTPELELSKTPEMRAALRLAAAAVRDLAEQYERQVKAPWMPPKGNRGQTMTVTEDADGVYVGNTDHLAGIVEWGSKNNPPHAPLRRAVRAAGLALVESPKP
jgi:hypothetical protein